jgi:predicted nucleic-acid-binding protein
MTTWESIKDLQAEINGVVQKSTKNPNKIYTNEEIMIMFLFKLNDRYRYSRLIDMGVQSDMDRLFLEGYEDKKNYIDMGVMQVDNYYLNSLKEKIAEIKSDKDVTAIPLIFRREQFTNGEIDKVLLVAAIPQINQGNNMGFNQGYILDKYRYLAKLLYENNSKYLEYAKESIINHNTNISLDKMVFGVDGITRLENKKQTPIEQFYNTCKVNKHIFILWIILVILILFFSNNAKLN